MSCLVLILLQTEVDSLKARCDQCIADNVDEIKVWVFSTHPDTLHIPAFHLANRIGSRPQNLKEAYAVACDKLKAEVQELQAEKEALEAKYGPGVTLLFPHVTPCSRTVTCASTLGGPFYLTPILLSTRLVRLNPTGSLSYLTPILLFIRLAAETSTHAESRNQCQQHSARLAAAVGSLEGTSTGP